MKEVIDRLRNDVKAADVEGIEPTELHQDISDICNHAENLIKLIDGRDVTIRKLRAEARAVRNEMEGIKEGSAKKQQILDRLDEYMTGMEIYDHGLMDPDGDPELTPAVLVRSLKIDT